jgi:hypothetical protein
LRKSRNVLLIQSLIIPTSTTSLSGIFPDTNHVGLLYESYDEEREWTRKEWPVMKWDFRKEMNQGDDSVAIEQNDAKFFLGSYCRHCGFSFEMQFDRIEGKWFLTYRQENNY